ncbi:MAG: hypothetical protein COA88_01360 [Kordia sp.]|nr:MAG: hypothetical protein COA88_01360 [Kordia sp.]
MKKLLFTLAIGLATLTSCESDLVSAPPSDSVEGGGGVVGVTTGNLVGSWDMISFNYDGTTVTTAQGVNITSDFVGQGSDYDYIIEFTEAPNNYSSIGTYDIELAVTTSGQTSTSNINDLIADSNGTWEKNANVLTFTNASNNNEVSDATIEILSDTTLKFTTSIVKNDSVQGVSVETTTTSVAVFERL